MRSHKIETILYQIIEKKFNELNRLRKKGKFSKIGLMEGNAVGQIGEEFVKRTLKTCKVNIVTEEDDIVHDEYDILLKNGKMIEVKTARKGLTNDTFQFNGLAPGYHYNYIILIGISEEDVKYYIITLPRGGICNEHKNKQRKNKQNYYVEVNRKIKYLVPMNPHSTTNFKLTLRKSELKDIDNFEEEIKNVFIKKKK